MTEPVHILIVEDENAHAAAIRRSFEAAGNKFRISVASTLGEYRRFVEENVPHIALMDLNLPDGRAVEVLTYPPEAGQFPVLLMTSYGNEHVAVEAIKAGALDYIVKSAESFTAMPRTVERSLREWRLRQERKHLEAQLEQAMKMEAVGRLAGGVAHDFNNILTVIIGYADITLGTLNPGDPIYGNIQEILQAAQRSAELTRQLLAFSRKQITAPKVIDLNEVISNNLKMLGRLMGEDISLTFTGGNNLRKVFVDPAQIHQILANLAVNARDAIEGVGRVSVTTENVTISEGASMEDPFVTPGRYTVLRFSDNGKGMETAIREHIFEPFFTTKGEERGTGLGLSTVYGIVKQNEGFITVDSESGKGTVFTIYFPAHQAGAESDDATHETRPLTGEETLLVVEDNRQLLDLAIIILGQYGYRVISASTPDEALRLCETHDEEIHLLLTDVIMPVMSGKDLAESLSALKPRMKTLFMSGYAANVVLKGGAVGDSVNFIQKPFSVEGLARKVREVLDG